MNDEEPKKKNEEYIEAAELFLKCKAPVKAAFCLKQANEGKLAADVYEGIGQVVSLCINVFSRIEIHFV